MYFVQWVCCKCRQILIWQVFKHRSCCQRDWEYITRSKMIFYFILRYYRGDKNVSTGLVCFPWRPSTSCLDYPGFVRRQFFFMKNGSNPINALWLEYWTRLSLWKYYGLSQSPWSLDCFTLGQNLNDNVACKHQKVLHLEWRAKREAEERRTGVLTIYTNNPGARENLFRHT